jgi:hemolysin activation/secretion protein
MYRHSKPLVGIILILCVDTSMAQEDLLPLKRPSGERPDLLEQQPFKPKKQPQLKLPPVEKPGKKEKQISQALKFKLKEIQFSDNTVFDDQTLTDVVADYIGKKVDTLDLQQMKNLVTKYYITAGYINSGAVIPDQDISKGSLNIQIIEGDLTQVRVQNKGRLNNAYISNRIRLDKQQPFNLYVLQERLYLLQQDPRIARINANLGPGRKRGESILDIAITEEKPYSLKLQLDNHRPPSIGEKQATLMFQHLNISGAGDTLNASIGYTEGLNNGSVRYDWPLTPDDQKLYVSYDKSDSAVVEEDIKALDIDIENDSDTTSLGYSIPFFKSSTESYEVAVQLDKRKSKSTLDGSPLSSSCDDIDRVTALRLIQTWLKFDRDNVYSFRNLVTAGLDALGSTQCPQQPDSRFASWLLQYQWAQQYRQYGIQTIFRADLQVAFDKLMSMEQFAVGGAYTVRGYRENQLVRDNGFVTSWEIRQRVYQSESAEQMIQIVGFADYGYAWTQQSPRDSANIYSIGTGLRWQWNKTASAELYWAKPLEDIDNPDDSLQDDGIHFKLVAYLL